MSPALPNRKRKSGMNPTLPKTVHIRIEGEAKILKRWKTVAKKGKAG